MTLTPPSGTPSATGRPAKPGEAGELHDFSEPPRLIHDSDADVDLRRDLRNYAVAGMPAAALTFDPLAGIERFEAQLEQLGSAGAEAASSGQAAASSGTATSAAPAALVKQGLLTQSLALKLGAGAVALSLGGLGVRQWSDASDHTEPAGVAQQNTEGLGPQPGQTKAITPAAEAETELPTTHKESALVLPPQGKASRAPGTAQGPEAEIKQGDERGPKAAQALVPSKASGSASTSSASKSSTAARPAPGARRTAKAKSRRTKASKQLLERARDEAELVARARRQLSRNPGRSLELLAEHRRRFAGGHLRLEAEGLEILALFGEGRDREARSRGRRYLARNPRAPLAARIQASME